MPTDPGGSRPAVTLVDDEPTVLDILTRAAASWQFECQAATSAEQALTLLERRPTPIVVTDLRMPGRGGLWLTREVQRRWPEMTVIVITAGGLEADTVRECLRAGARHYFLKPINLDEFRHALQATLHSHRKHAQRERHRQRLERIVRSRTEQVRHTFLSAINSLVRALEARDPYTSGHSLRVCAYSLRLAGALGLEAPERRRLSLAAKLHDIGKVGVPEAVLNKAGELTPQEAEQIRAHPAIGERILTPIIRDRAVLAGIRSHHERFDGRGYPDGLAGADIPFLARVVAVADCFDALTSSRAYRQALPPAVAVEVIRAGAGTQFDPAVVGAFLGVGGW
jgi:response regulator RpfG family c-di-GMP phosphodiesterase